MNVSAYIRRTGEIAESDLACRCCGAVVYALLSVEQSICNFCEAYVTYEDKNVIPKRSEIEKDLRRMQESVFAQKWAEGAAYADAIAATKDPHLLFGAAAFYRAFSDYVYLGVDYTIGGFMYPNAARRSDEPKTPGNAVALMSKSKGYLFKALKIIDSDPDPPDQLLYLDFISNMALKRYELAEKSLFQINSKSKTELANIYARMAFNVERRGKFTEKYIDGSFSYGIANSFYYLSKYVAMKRQLGTAIKILDGFMGKVNMPKAAYLYHRLKDFKSASDI